MTRKRKAKAPPAVGRARAAAATVIAGEASQADAARAHGVSRQAVNQALRAMATKERS